MSIINDLKSSKSFKYTASYLGVCFVVLQVMDPLSERGIISGKLFEFFLYLLVACIPISTIIGFIADRKNKKTIGKKFQINFNIIGATAALFIIFYLSITNLQLKQKYSDIDWARQDAIPQLYEYINESKVMDAFKLAKQIENVIPDDSMLVRAWPKIARKVSIITDPKESQVYWNKYGSESNEWELLGSSPLIEIYLPNTWILFKIEKENYITSTEARHPYYLSTGENTFILNKLGSLPENMVFVSGGMTALNIPGLDHLEKIEIPSYYIDIYEVTNKQYQEFVDIGGYNNRDYWVKSFEKNGKEITFEKAMNQFKDATGVLGPSNWEAGNFKEGEGKHPVSGISWYEASAYAKFKGKKLPTIYHWNKAANTRLSSYLVPKSNFDNKGTSPVGQYKGISHVGVYDLAGNVREWCSNETNTQQKIILGGGFDDLTYMFNDVYSQDAWDRSKTNGFRCIINIDGDSKKAENIVELPQRDFLSEKPVNDETFQLYLSMYKYDKKPLDSEVQIIDESSDFFVREKITFNAAYDNERMFAYLYTPKKSSPPYKTIVYFPGSGAIHNRNSSELNLSRLDFLLKSGYAIIYPIYKGTYERDTGLKSDYGDETVFYKDHVIWWGKDLRRSIDYLETRKDIDVNNLAYYGTSWGGEMGAIMVPIEPRFKAAILYVAGMIMQRSLPEVDAINYIGRLKIPTIMLNGKYDHFFPLVSSQIPMFKLMGTPKEDKKHYVYESGHFVPRKEMINQSLSWLRKYLD
jgi:dienelactone hydrolase